MRGGNVTGPAFEAQRHETLRDDAWDEARARDEIAEIVALTEAAYDEASFWPDHPLDLDGRPPRGPSASLYYGASGVVLVLRELARRDLTKLSRDWSGAARAALAHYERRPPFGRRHPGLLLGESGVAFAAFQLAATPELAAQVLRCIEANFDAAEDELMWGSPGTLALARPMFEATGDARFRDAFRRGAARLLERLREVPQAGCRLWLQDLYGAKSYLLGAVHGFSGNVAPLLSGLDWLPSDQRDRLLAEVPRSLAATAQLSEAGCNWPQSVVQHRPGRAAALVQICHGAPGVVCALRDFPVGLDAELERLLDAAGELTWSAGPLAKGGGLCHGSAGNGYAFLTLHHRRGDERLLARARRFAMHAVAQSRAQRVEHGRARFSLWTGDLGLALFLADCIRGDGGVPTFTAW